MQYFGFQLGREWKLSVAEILSVFPNGEILFSCNSTLILGNISKNDIEEKFNTLGGTIKVFELQLFSDIEDIFDEIVKIGENNEGKFKYAVNIFGGKGLSLKNILKKTKNLLKNNNISARYFNKEDGKNLSSAQILGNSILKKGFDFNIIDLGNVFYFGKTLAVQDIDAYSKRDFSKNRDMQVGMLPPKLCQMMLNIGGNKNSVYDPFVGLGTILIEAINMGIIKVYGSDLSDKMVEESEQNITNFIARKNLKNISKKFEKLNAKFINESTILQNEKIDLIATEGYLGEIMTKKNISLDRIDKQKESLLSIYTKFFENLAKTNFLGNIVICFPYWDFKGKYIYFSEILPILEQYCTVEKIFTNHDFDLTSKTGSLLYKREKQLVGREIFKLSLKK